MLVKPATDNRETILVFTGFLISRRPFLGVVVEEPSYGPKEDGTDDGPEGRHVVVFEDRLQAGKTNPADQYDQDDRHDGVGPEAAGVDFKRPLQVGALLEEREGPNQEEVREGRGNVPHVGQNQVELLSSRTPESYQEDEDGHNDGLKPHRVGGHADFVELGHLLRPQLR